MENFLRSLNLEIYLDGFLENGFDELTFLKSLQISQLSRCFLAVGVKVGHQMIIENALKSSSGEASGIKSTVENNAEPEAVYPDSITDLYVSNDFSPQLRFFNEVFNDSFKNAYSKLKNVEQFRKYVRSQHIHRWNPPPFDGTLE